VSIAPGALFNNYLRWRSVFYSSRHIIIYLYWRGIINV